MKQFLLTLSSAITLLSVLPAKAGDTIASSALATGSTSEVTESAVKEAVADKGFTYKLDGRVQLRNDSFNGLYSQFGDTVNALYVRRVDLGVSGRLLRNLHYEIEAEYADKKTKFKSASISYDGWKYLSVIAGRFKPEFGLDLSTSHSWTSGIERSSIWDLAPDAGDTRDGYGLALRGSGKHFHYSLDLNRGFDLDSGIESTSASLRTVYMPIQRSGELLQFGFSYADMGKTESNGRIHSRLGVRGVTEVDEGNRSNLARKLTDGAFNADRTWAVELAYQQGPFSLQSELLRRDLSGSNIAIADRQANGAYVQLAYTLTGEARRYNLDGAHFGSIRPENANLGAWEIFYRHDTLSVDGEPGLIRPLRDRSKALVDAIGVNWYATRATKLSVDFSLGRTNNIYNDAGNASGKALSLQAQYQF